jgi:hypothetical protein
MSIEMKEFPRFFRVQQTFPRPTVSSIESATLQALKESRLLDRLKPQESVAITVGSRGIQNISLVIRTISREIRSAGGIPFAVPAMGSHGGATADGQINLLKSLGITSETIECEIRSSMDTVVIGTAREGFPVHFDQHAFKADHVFVVNRIKPHTRFYGSVESGLMKMMLIGLGKHAGAIVYHRVIQSYSFDQIVRSVASEVLRRCNIAGGIAILENGYEETAAIVGIAANEIYEREAALLAELKPWLPRLPFDHAELLILDEIGKNISGTGMDTNIIGRKSNDRSAIGDERPRIHHIYVRSLTQETAGNASGIGIAELCHRRVLNQLDPYKTRLNSITAGHVAAASTPVDFPTDRDAIQTAIELSGWGPIDQFPAMWIRNTLQLEEVICSEAYWDEAQHRPDLRVISPLFDLDWLDSNDLVEQFRQK